MRIVSRYLLVEFLRGSAAVFLGLLVTFASADMLLHLDDFAVDVSGGFRALLLRSLELVGLGVPLSCLVGVVWSLTRAVRNREITAIRCGGIPLRATLVPLLLASAGIALGIAVLEDRVIMPLRQALERADSEAQQAEAGSHARPRQLNDRWWYANGTSIFSAGAYDATSHTLSDVSVFRLDDSRNVSERIDAHSAVNLEGNLWEFRGAIIRGFDPDGTLHRSSVRALRVDLGLSGTDLEQASPPAHTTTLHKLRRAIDQRRGNDDELVLLETAFHGRLAQPFSVLILVLLALPFAIGDGERRDSLPRALLSSIAAAGAFWLTWTLSLLVGRTGLLPAFAPIWACILLALTIGLWRYRRISE